MRGEVGTSTRDRSDRWQGSRGAPGSEPRRGFGRLVGLATLACLCVLAAFATPALAATDTLFASPSGTGDCSSAANACSIATAVTNANAEPVTDSVVIELAHGIYQLSSPSPTALTITFAGPSLTFAAENGTAVLDGEKTVALMSIGATSNVTIDGLEIEFGSTSGSGGAIDNRGTVTVRNATFASNTAANGGAIADETGGTLVVRDSTFSHNTTTGVGGGAILASGSTTVERSAIIDNTAPINGGGINVQGAGTTTVASSTIAGNVSGSVGGGVSNLGHLTVEASTLTDNAGGGGGAAMATASTNVMFAADIIGAQSSGAACSPATTSTTTSITDVGYNLDDDGTCISATTSAPGSHNGTTADGSSTYGAVLEAYLAGGPANHGGPTQTVALMNNPIPSTTLPNPALAVVPPSFSLPVAVDGASSACSVPDQRGVVPAPGLNCDIGAYLLQATNTALATSAATVSQNGSVTYTATVTPSPDGGSVSFNDGAGNPATAHCAAQSVSSGTATCTVSYANPGTYSVTATYSGDGALNNYAGSASSAHTVTVSAPVVPPPVVPTLSNLHVSPHRFNAAGRNVHGRCVPATKKNQHAKACQLAIRLKATYTLNSAARVSFKLALKTTGRRVNGRCVKATHKNTRHPTCTLLVRAHNPITRSGKIGSNTLRFSAKLAAGTYELTVTPAGGAPRTVTFRVTG